MNSQTHHAPDDGALLALTAQGDQQAFRQLVQRHLPMILRCAERITGSAAEADDIAQEVAIRMWRKAPDWSTKTYGQLTTWLYRVTTNLSIDHKRKKITLPLTAALNAPSKEQTGLERAEQSSTSQLVRQALDRLPDKQRLVVILTYYEHLSVIEAAQVLETTPGAVSALLHRGRKTLKQTLGELALTEHITDSE